ncbi:MAG: hypothetical protein KY455_07915 [Euryarchaeota archaeon]|nr:hypothetical protein [Euryarchaeota archaeon]
MDKTLRREGSNRFPHYEISFLGREVLEDLAALEQYVHDREAEKLLGRSWDALAAAFLSDDIDVDSLVLPVGQYAALSGAIAAPLPRVLEMMERTRGKQPESSWVDLLGLEIHGPEGGFKIPSKKRVTTATVQAIH